MAVLGDERMLPMTDGTLPDAALSYALVRGWRVFPLHDTVTGSCSCGEDCGRDAGKHPRVRGGFEAGTVDPDTIRSWWQQWPNANIGVATGAGLFVLDVDGPVGSSTLAELLGTDLLGLDDWLDEQGLRQLTPHGCHVVYRMPDGEPLRNTAGKLGPGLDTRGEGGYIVVPPSATPAGAYEWSSTNEPGTAPAWLVDRLKQDKPRGLQTKQDSGVSRPADTSMLGAYVAAAVTAAVDDLGSAAPGTRNDALNEQAFRLGTLGAHGVLDAETASAALWAGWEANGSAVYSDGQASFARTFRSGWTSGLASPRSPWPPVERPAPAHVGFSGPIRTLSAPDWPSPSTPLPVARRLADPHTRWWRGDFYRWAGTHWSAIREEVVTAELYRTLESARYRNADGERKPWNPTRKTVSDVRHALAHAVLLDTSDPEPDLAIACRNGVVNLADRALSAHDPSRFNLSSLPFDYDPDATCPEWSKFLLSVLPDDAIDFIQQWFGYIISGRTDQQKIANLVGPKRSGKGTIARILEALVGPEFVASPTLSTLAKQFGRQPLIGKSLAVMADVTWNVRDAPAAVEALKGISGEDSQDVDRKGRESWHGRLMVRFLLMGNDIPRFTDASGALSSRMIHVEFPHSFAGREDHGLSDRLMTELPGIFVWALAGLDRLNAAGRFVEPLSSSTLADEVRRQDSPVRAFLEDRCVITNEPTDTIDLMELLVASQHWAREEGYRPIETSNVFSKALRAAQVNVTRPRVDGMKRRIVVGIRPAYPGAWNLTRFAGSRDGIGFGRTDTGPTPDRQWTDTD